MGFPLLRPGIIELSNLMRHGKCLHYLKDYRNILMLNKLSDANISFSLNIVSKISTSNILLKSKDKFKEKKKIVHVNHNEVADIVNIERILSQFEGIIENFKEQMVKHVGVRTRAGSIEELPITYEEKLYNLEELVEIGRKANMVILNVTAFPQIIPNILEALARSQMNLNPQQEGTTIYVPLPKVTKEHRENLTKVAKQYFVKCKVAISDIRNEHIRHLKKKEKLPKDLIFKAESYINSLQKQYTDKADHLLKTKEKELLGES